MLWIWIAFIEPILHALANVIDNYFVNKLVRSPVILVFISVLIDLLLLPLVFLIQIPGIPSASLLPFFLLVGLTNVLYMWPYYKALQHDDTSVVTSLFSLGKIFVPLLAFLIVGEVLSLTQYIGFLLIVFCGAAATLNNHNGTFRLNKAFFYMLLCSFILAFEVVIYKYILNNVDWSTGFTWGTLFSFVLILPVFLIGKNRHDLRQRASIIWRNKHLFLAEEFLTFAGSGAGLFAISLAPVTLVEGISGFQPFFVLLYAILFSKFFRGAFKEKITAKDIIKKALLFAIMVLGVILATSN